MFCYVYFCLNNFITYKMTHTPCAKIRFINNVTDTKFDILIDETVRFKDLNYQQYTSFDPICSSSYRIDLKFKTDLVTYMKHTPRAGVSYTVLITGSFECGILLCIYTDTFTESSKYAHIRFIHSVPGLEPVHLREGSRGNESQLISSVAYTTTGYNHEYYGINAGLAQLSVQSANTSSIIVDLVKFTFEAQATYTLILSQPKPNFYFILCIKDT
jgi:hypothetical protein